VRITNRMMADAVTQDIARQRARLFQAQETVSSGRRINRPSDDPQGAGRAAIYRETLTTLGGFGTAISRADTRLAVADANLESMSDLLGTATTLLRNAPGMDAVERQAAAEEIAQIREQVRDFANGRFEGDYLFAGHQVRGETPLAPDGTYRGDDGEIRAPAGPDQTVTVNVTGNDLFLIDGDDNAVVFGILDQAAADLSAGNDPDPDAANQVAAARERIQGAQARSATRRFRLDASREALESVEARVEGLLADLENADIEAAIVELRVQETAYETALQTAARVLPPKLLDFLR
jgi:flagellar hook-associated protein 3 FlgL